MPVVHVIDPKLPKFDTLSVHGDAHADPVTGSRAVPICQTTSTIFQDSDHAASLFNLETPGHIYTRISNPAVAVFYWAWRIALGLFVGMYIAKISRGRTITLAASASRRLSATEEPATFHRVFWAFPLGALPVALVYLDGLEPVKTAAVVASLPLLLEYVLFAWLLLRMLGHNGDMT